MRKFMKICAFVMTLAMVLGMTAIVGSATAMAAETKVTIYIEPGDDWGSPVCLDMWGEGFSTNLTENASITAWNESREFPKMIDEGNGWWSVQVTNPSAIGGFQFVTDGCYYDDATSDTVKYWSFTEGDWLQMVQSAQNGESVWFSRIDVTCVKVEPEGWSDSSDDANNDSGSNNENNNENNNNNNDSNDGMDNNNNNDKPDNDNNNENSGADNKPNDNNNNENSGADNKPNDNNDCNPVKPEGNKPSCDGNNQDIQDENVPSADGSGLDGNVPHTGDMAPLVLVTLLGIASATVSIVICKKRAV